MRRPRRPRVTIATAMILTAVLSLPLGREANRIHEEARLQHEDDAINRAITARREAADRANAAATLRVQEIEAREKAEGIWVEPPSNWEELRREARQRAAQKSREAEERPQILDLLLREKPAFRPM